MRLACAEVSIETSWKEKLANEFAAEYMSDLSQFLRMKRPLVK